MKYFSSKQKTEKNATGTLFCVCVGKPTFPAYSEEADKPVLIATTGKQIRKNLKPFKILKKKVVGEMEKRDKGQRKERILTLE